MSADQIDLLMLVNAAGIEGITVEGIMSQASAVGIRMARESAELNLRVCMRSGLAEIKGTPPRWFITAKGNELVTRNA